MCRAQFGEFKYQLHAPAAACSHQRSFVVQRHSPSPDAAGGVRALAAAVQASTTEIAQWLQDLPLPVN